MQTGLTHHYPTFFHPEDLLGRKPIILQQNNITARIRHSIILITGAAGSIGSELACQICSYGPGKLILLDQAESLLHDLDLNLRQIHPDIQLHTCVANITDVLRMSEIFSQNRIQMVFHAAAYKHVPFMEKHPYEAIKTNVIGTTILADLSVAWQVEKFIFISTDKAVKPASVMGATKRFGEIYLQHLSRTYPPATEFITTRFGNVLGSNGSFLPRFAKQIREGGPITVTHPDAERYMMTVSEACQLVLEASATGNGGETLCFDMGNPVRITDIAKRMILLSGLRPDVDIQLEYVGLRPGEKLCEDLYDETVETVTHHPKIRITALPSCPSVCIGRIMSDLQKALDSGRPDSMVAVLKMAIPEYISHNSQFQKLDSLQTISSDPG